MSKKYGVGEYGINLYSAALVFPGEAVVAAAYFLIDDGDLVAGASAAVSGVFTATATANFAGGGAAQPYAEYTLSAIANPATQQVGEAFVTAFYYLSAAAAIENNVSVLPIMADYTLMLDPYAGNYWDPETSKNPWKPDPKLNDIWVKEAASPQPWRN